MSSVPEHRLTVLRPYLKFLKLFWRLFHFVSERDASNILGEVPRDLCIRAHGLSVQKTQILLKGKGEKGWRENFWHWRWAWRTSTCSATIIGKQASVSILCIQRDGTGEPQCMTPCPNGSISNRGLLLKYSPSASALTSFIYSSIIFLKQMFDHVAFLLKKPSPHSTSCRI